MHNEIELVASSKDLWRIFSLHTKSEWVHAIVDNMKVCFATIARKIGVKRYELIKAMNGNGILPRNANIMIKLLYSSIKEDVVLDGCDMRYIIDALLKKYGSHQKIARALNVRRGTISFWESGIRAPGIQSINNILKALDISLEDA